MLISAHAQQRQMNKNRELINNPLSATNQHNTGPLVPGFSRELTCHPDCSMEGHNRGPRYSAVLAVVGAALLLRFSVGLGSYSGAHWLGVAEGVFPLSGKGTKPFVFGGYVSRGELLKTHSNQIQIPCKPLVNNLAASGCQSETRISNICKSQKHSTSMPFLTMPHT